MGWRNNSILKRIHSYCRNSRPNIHWKNNLLNNRGGNSNCCIGKSIKGENKYGIPWAGVTLTITTGAGSGTQPTISYSVDGTVYLQLTRPINSTFTYLVGIGVADGSTHRVCLDSTCVTITTFWGYAAADGSTPPGTIMCYTPTNRTVYNMT